MDQPFISLLWQDAAAKERHTDPRNRPDVRDSVCREMGLTGLLGLRDGSPVGFFTSEPEVIRYREATFEDLLTIPELGKTLSDVVPLLSDITELRRLDRDLGSSSGESYLYSITEIELYIAVIDLLHKGLSPVKDKIKSPAFGALSSFISEYVESEYYRDLNERLKKLSSRVREIRSITDKEVGCITIK